ncbi:MAG: hypothetical protein ACK4N5_23405, partial [Myxococcales bacterium]
QEAARILAESIDLARQGQIALRDPSFTPKLPVAMEARGLHVVPPAKAAEQPKPVQKAAAEGAQSAHR